MKRAILLVVILVLVIIAIFISRDKKVYNNINKNILLNQGFSQEDINIIQGELKDALH